MNVGIVYDDIFKKHVARYPHPECPQRLDAVIKGFKQANLWHVSNLIEPQLATIEQLETVHHPKYIEQLLSVLTDSQGNIDADTFFSKDSKEAALKAAGGAVELVNKVHDRELDWGFNAARPPGHHATRTRACGFCMINNISVAAADLLKSGKAKKVAIVDFDVHHGNGTQDQFYTNPDVLYFSIHQWPHFPGSGLVDELGQNDGMGASVNIPYPPGMGLSEYVYAFNRVLLPLLFEFEPQHILVSAGFDAHESDPLCSMELPTVGFKIMVELLKNAAKQLCDSRLTFMLEGGYDLYAIADCVKSVCDAMEADSQKTHEVDESTVHPKAVQIIQLLEKRLSSYWPKIF